MSGRGRKVKRKVGGGGYVGGGGRKRKKKIMMVYVGGGREKKEKIIIIIINNIIIKFKSKNQNYVPNTKFFLNCDFNCETKIMYQTNFFFFTILNSNQD